MTERIAILLSLARIVSSEDVRLTVSGVARESIKQWALTLQELFHRLTPHKMFRWNGLMTICVDFARLCGPVVLETDHDEPRMSGVFN